MASRPLQLSLATYLQSVKPPWTALLVLKAGQRAEATVKMPEGFLRLAARGEKCRSVQGLFAELAEALQFPDYFGHNWDALEECLTDFEWLPAKGYVLLFTNAESVLPYQEEEFATLLEVLSDAGEAWASGQASQGAKRATPFHTLLAVSEREQSALMASGLPQVTASASPTRPQGKTKRSTR